MHVNGEDHDLRGERYDTLVDALRDGAGLTGTKLVCGAGVCGACTVHLDGEAVVSCLVPTATVAERSVTTVEALGRAQSDGLHPVQRALVGEDGLQCGFCTPGFAMEAAAFVDRWRGEPANAGSLPEEARVAAELSGHLCRCGAYPGILRAVRRACAGDYDDPVTGDSAGPATRVEAVAKVTGAARYTVDVRLEGQLVGRIVRSPHPHAVVRAVDLSAARALPGVGAAVELVAPGGVVRYVGQEVAAVAATDLETAERATALVRVDYEVLPAAVGAEAARRSDASRVYPGLRKSAPNSAEGPLFPTPWRGNVRGPTSGFSVGRGRAKRRLARARTAGDPLLVEGIWTSEAQVHTPLEPHACVAHWRAGDDGIELELHVSTQAVAHLRHLAAERFGLEAARVRVLAEHVGGAFGNKLALTGETVAAVELSRAAGAPVGVTLDRAEELTVGGYRPATRLDVALLADTDRRLRALRFHAHGDAGVAIGSAIAGLARVIYPCDAKDLVDYDVVSHLPPGTPFRGPGGPLTCWALEQAVDEAATRLGTDPITLRRGWDPDPLRGALYDWVETLPTWRDRESLRRVDTGAVRRGVGVAAANWFYWYDPAGEVEVAVEGDRVVVATAVQDLGTGVRTVLAHTVAEVLDIDVARVDVRLGDSRLAPGPTSGGSRTTATLVPAAQAAAARLGRELDGDWRDHRVTERRGADPDTDAASRPFAGAGPVGWVFEKTLRRQGRLNTGRGWTGAVVVSEVEVDTRLGHVRVVRVHEGLAVGRPQARRLAESQVHGAIVQGVGFALYEQRQADDSGLVLSAGLEDYRLPGIADTPEIDVHFHEAGFEHVAGGGVGLGEVSTLAVAASIGNAVRHATGWRPHDLPMRPDRVLAGLGSLGGVAR